MIRRMKFTRTQMQGSDERTAWYDEADKRNFTRGNLDGSAYTHSGG